MAIARYLKLEAIWILVNVGYADEEVIMNIFDKNLNIIEPLNEIINAADDISIWSRYDISISGTLNAGDRLWLKSCRGRVIWT